MENINNAIPKLLEVFKGAPWYLKIIIPLEMLVALIILFFVLVCVTQITKTLFTIDFAAVCYLVYTCTQEGLPNVSGVIFGALLIAALVLLFFIIYIADDDGSGIIMTFFGSLYSGMVNIGLIFACATLVLIPLAAMAWGRNDRY